MKWLAKKKFRNKDKLNPGLVGVLKRGISTMARRRPIGAMAGK